MIQDSVKDGWHIRHGARVLLVTPSCEVLLMKLRDPANGIEFWVVPGGGLNVGETAAEAARREVREETGLAQLELGPAVWTRRHKFEWEGRRIDQRERFFLAHVERFTPSHDGLEAGVERRAFRELRWWQLEAITASQETFTPRALAKYLRSLWQEGPPQTPIDVGI